MSEELQGDPRDPACEGESAGTVDFVGGEADYSAVLSRVRASVRLRAQLVPREAAQAALRVDDLMARPHARRRLLVRNSDRYRSWCIGDLLLQRCASAWFGSPRHALELAQLALDVADRLDRACYGSGPVEDLRALALASMGNCRRIFGELVRAQECFERAQEAVERGSGDQLLLARLDSLRSLLLASQERSREASQLLDRSLELYLRSGDAHAVGKVMLIKARVMMAAGEARSASWLLRRALRWIDGAREPRLLLVARHNLVCCALALGDVAHASRMLHSTEDLHRRYPECALENSRRWLRESLADAIAAVRSDDYRAAAGWMMQQPRSLERSDSGADGTAVS